MAAPRSLPRITLVALALTLGNGCARHARGAKLSFEERFNCTPDSVEKEGDRWVVTGCRRRAEYECGWGAGHTGDLGESNCHIVALTQPRLARTFAKGVRVDPGADGKPVVRARTGRSAPQIELRASPSTAPDVAIWLVAPMEPTAACDATPRVWIDGVEIPADEYRRSDDANGAKLRFRTPLSVLRGSADARRIRLDLCAQPVVLAEAECQVVADFAIRATEGR